MAKVFVYFVSRSHDNVEQRIALQDWKTVLDCLSHLDGVDDEVVIHRMEVFNSDSNE